ncbi:cytochrome P450 [Actinomadura kijaniata]|uniref:Cytochrome P450 n=1 Tax=Actinomadura namibiensis TaxID=182080 RepID=A0A7W3LRT9_ACTNM|nr:cytochrome P450 [Actinomadura namibiensis]MBA8953057.1 cytochrome P450 [Actinomadura namibiensis]
MVDATRGRGGADFVEGRCPRHLVGRFPVAEGRTVTLLREADGVGEWLVTGYEAGRAVLRDPRFARGPSAGLRRPRGPAARMSVTDLDPPEHGRIRRLVGRAFSPRRVAALQPRVERMAEVLLDQLHVSPATGDLLRDFCVPLTFGAQCELLGVPPARREVIFQCATERLGPPEAGPAEVYRGELRLHAAVVELLADREEPPAGLLGELVAAHREGGLGGWDDLTGLAASLFFDGHALAAAQIANAAHRLLSSPALAERLRADPRLLDGVVEESLRHSPAVTLSMARTATSDVEVDGVRIRAGDQVSVALPVANRDGTVFADPHRFRTDRASGGHLAFGHGAHFCLGAHLARVEMRVALGALVRRTPRLRLAVPSADLGWWVSSSRRSLVSLPVRTEPVSWRRSPAAHGAVL